jgi:hypothetical protein
MKKTFLTPLFVIITICLLVGSLVHAQTSPSPSASTGVLTNSNNLQNYTAQAAHTANFGDTSFGDILSLIIQLVLGFLGIVFIIMTIISGFRWMTANGNEEQIQKATDAIRASIIGLIIVILAYAVTYYVLYYVPFGGSGASTMKATT